MTLRWRLTIAFVLVVLVPLLVGVALVERAIPRAVQARQETGVVSSARLVGQVVRDFCDRARTTAEAAGRASTATTPAGARAAARSLIGRELADGLRVVAPTGRLVVALGTVPRNPVDCGDASTGATGPYLNAVVNLSTPAGRPAGRAVATFTVSAQLLTRLQRAVGEGHIVLVGSTGTVVASTGSFAPELIRNSMRAPSSRGTAGWVTAYAPASDDGQTYGVIVLQPAAKGPGVLADASAFVGLAILLAIGIAVLSARTTTKPLEELGLAAARIASGDLSTVIDVRSKDEVGRLATAFNAMTDDLRGYVGQLQDSRDELQSGLARLGETLSSTHDLDGILRVVLESALAATRATSGMVLLLTPAREELVLSASQGLDVAPDLRIPMGGGVSGRVAQSGEPLRGQVGLGEHELAPAPGEPTATSVISVPLKSSGALIGVLNLYDSALPRGFDDSALATILTFAGQATVAVDNVLLHEEAQRLSITDGLTGLWNYRYFTMTLRQEIERAARFGRPLALLMLDLDHFKAVNDTFGHPRGDAVLIELAGRIRGEVRDVDTVARYGGEEIVVVLPETDAEGAAQLAERICQAVRGKPFDDPGMTPVHVTISVGGAVFPHHGQSTSVLLARADDAMYDAKRAGRDTWRISTGAPTAVTLPE